MNLYDALSHILSKHGLYCAYNAARLAMAWLCLAISGKKG